MDILDRGTQIIYVPNHANGNIDHRDCEYGYVNSDNGGDVVYCRFWRKDNNKVLRTKSNAEGVSRRYLVKMNSVPTAQVNWAMWNYS